MFLKRVYYLYMINLKIMLSFPKVVIIDELSINEDNRSRIMSGVTSELEETLAWLADNTAMTLAALSSTSLLDTDTAAVSQTALDAMIARTGFVKSIRLEFIMRSSQKIAAATSPASVNLAYDADSNYRIQEKISPGSSSTVPGTRPRALVYEDTPDSPDVNYTKLAGFVTQHLRTVDIEQIKCVVLTGLGISARMLSTEIGRNTPVSLFDGGVETFDYHDTPKYAEVRASDLGEAELTEWLEAEAGVLVTHEMQFRGAECDSVIYITGDWGGHSSISRRSPVTRAVAGLLLITSDFGLSVPELRRNWDGGKIRVVPAEEILS